MLLLAVAGASAQSLFGSILGTVADRSGAVVPGAQVKARNAATNAARTTTASDAGDFQIPTLPVGVYEVSVEAKGFKRALAPSVTVAVDQRVRAISSWTWARSSRWSRWPPPRP